MYIYIYIYVHTYICIHKCTCIYIHNIYIYVLTCTFFSNMHFCFDMHYFDMHSFFKLIQLPFGTQLKAKEQTQIIHRSLLYVSFHTSSFPLNFCSCVCRISARRSTIPFLIGLVYTSLFTCTGLFSHIQVSFDSFGAPQNVTMQTNAACNLEATATQ